MLRAPRSVLLGLLGLFSATGLCKCYAQEPTVPPPTQPSAAADPNLPAIPATAGTLPALTPDPVPVLSLEPGNGFPARFPDSRVSHEPDAPVESLRSGGGGFSPFMSPDVGHAPLRTDYRFTWFTPEPVSNQPTRLGYFRQDLTLSCPIWHCETTDEILAHLNVRNEFFQTHAILPDTGQAFPADLWNIRVGSSYRHLFDNGWITGGSVNFGSASDRPFHSIGEMTVGLNAFLRVPQGDHNAWLFSLAYSPTAELPFPIPMAAFVWQPSEAFRVNLGLPFQLMWRPTDDLAIDLSYMLLTTIHARTTYRLGRAFSIYVAYASETEGYFLAYRVSDNDRFFNVDQRVTGGLQYHFSRKAMLDLSSGYVFDHYFFEGHNIRSGTQFNRVDVGDGPFVGLQFSVRW